MAAAAIFDKKTRAFPGSALHGGNTGYALGGANLEADELAQRVGIVKRFRELLQVQRDRFRNYLEVLDTQQGVITAGTAEEINAHIALEEQLVADIFSIQKVLSPLETLYYTAYPEKIAPQDSRNPREEPEISDLRSALEELRKDAVQRTERNKELLSKRMTELRSELKHLRLSAFSTGSSVSVYGRNEAPLLIDIQG